MRLAHVMDSYESMVFQNPTQFLRDVLQHEQQAREEGKIKRLLRKAKFPQLKTFEGYTFESVILPENCSQQKLKHVSFLEKHENVILMGAVGTGKTHLAMAMGVEACRQGKRVRFFRAADLVSLLQTKFQLGSLERFRKELLTSDMLILDELGFISFHPDGTNLLFHLLSDCYEHLSVIVTTNLEFSQWNTVFQDNQLTAALIDRLVHHAHILPFTGESYRLRNALTHH